MPGFFEALENFKPQKRQPYVVTIEGLSIVVSLERKLEIMRAGEDAYMWQKGEVVKKKRIPAEQRQPLMYKADKGVKFYKKNPFWTTGHNREGFEWKIE